jgi:hypothetical protein
MRLSSLVLVALLLGPLLGAGIVPDDVGVGRAAEEPSGEPQGEEARDARMVVTSHTRRLASGDPSVEPTAGASL